MVRQVRTEPLVLREPAEYPVRREPAELMALTALQERVGLLVQTGLMAQVVSPERQERPVLAVVLGWMARSMEARGLQGRMAPMELRVRAGHQAVQDRQAPVEQMELTGQVGLPEPAAAMVPTALPGQAVRAVWMGRHLVRAGLLAALAQAARMGYQGHLERQGPMVSRGATVHREPAARMACQGHLAHQGRAEHQGVTVLMGAMALLERVAQMDCRGVRERAELEKLAPQDRMVHLERVERRGVAVWMVQAEPMGHLGPAAAQVRRELQEPLVLRERMERVARQVRTV
jgi:hypothetical protein